MGSLGFQNADWIFITFEKVQKGSLGDQCFNWMK